MGHNRRQQQRRPPMGIQEAQALLQRNNTLEQQASVTAMMQQAARIAQDPLSDDSKEIIDSGSWIIPQPVLVAMAALSDGPGVPESVASMIVAASLLQVTVQGGDACILNVTAALKNVSWNNQLARPVVTDEVRRELDIRFCKQFNNMAALLQQRGFKIDAWKNDKGEGLMEVRWNGELNGRPKPSAAEQVVSNILGPDGQPLQG